MKKTLFQVTAKMAQPFSVYSWGIMFVLWVILMGGHAIFVHSWGALCADPLNVYTCLYLPAELGHTLMQQLYSWGIITVGPATVFREFGTGYRIAVYASSAVVLLRDAAYSLVLLIRRQRPSKR